jgi:hypothetical protein
LQLLQLIKQSAPSDYKQLYVAGAFLESYSNVLQLVKDITVAFQLKSITVAFQKMFFNRKATVMFLTS